MAVFSKERGREGGSLAQPLNGGDSERFEPSLHALRCVLGGVMDWMLWGESVIHASV